MNIIIVLPGTQASTSKQNETITLRKLPNNYECSSKDRVRRLIPMQAQLLDHVRPELNAILSRRRFVKPHNV